MGRAEVTFDVGWGPTGGTRVVATYDRSLLRLGSKVFVRHDENGRPDRFTPQPSRNSEAYAVTWIAPSGWVVSLENRFKSPPDSLVESIIDATSNFVDRTIVLMAIDRTTKEGRLEHIYKTSELEKSRLGKIISVGERLQLIDSLYEEEVGKALFRQWEPLCVYLLLTCFDLLGQPSPYLHFNEWLKSRKRSAEHEAVLQRLGSEGDELTRAAEIYAEYEKTYGTGRSFYRFIREILPPDSRSRLLGSIRIESIGLPPELEPRIDMPDEYKEKYLYQLRNTYTHSARFRVGWNNAIFGLEDDIWRANYEQRIEAKAWINVSTITWAAILRDTVRAGFASFLRSIAEHDH